MQYKYFTEKLYTQGGLDLNQVFPDKSEIAKQQTNLDYGLPEIVKFVKEKSQDFKVADRYLIDFDYAIKEIVSRYYKSIGKDNPFVTDEDKQEIDKYQEGVKPRKGVTTEDGKIKVREGQEPAETTTAKPKILGKDELIQKYKGYMLLYKMKKDESFLNKAKATQTLLRIVHKTKV